MSYIFHAIIHFTGDPSVGISAYSYEMQLPPPQDDEDREYVRELIKQTYIEIDGEFIPRVYFSDEKF